MNLDIGSKQSTKKSFELVLQVRDKEGSSTGMTKSYVTDDVVKLHKFFIRNSGTQKKKKRKTEAAKDDKQINTALKEIKQYTDDVRKKRNLNE